ncbi:maleate cis-trans isomerase [Pseudactinotalea sp. HY160]|uniref:maleate cis-trans isomerase family protein n=1 Tax=Pseudactinotalea sp. HY160 TaxID=2654490 RepID=UPI001D149777|nr:maleate cis-trans isomerase [Pseudactinotalea sp. HY160]
MIDPTHEALAAREARAARETHLPSDPPAPTPPPGHSDPAARTAEEAHGSRRPRPALTAGMIYPDHAAEDDYPLGERLLGVHLPVAHIYGTDLHAVPELLDLGSPDKLAGGAAELSSRGLDSIMWACTSGSFVYGPQGALRQVEELAAAAGVPASSTSLAFVTAAASLGVSRVAVAASYPDDVAALFVDYLTAAGIEIVAAAGAGIDTAAEVGTLSRERVIALALARDHRDAEALLVPDTAMRTLGVVGELEARLGKPVLTANQVTIWEGLRLADPRREAPVARGLGALFAARTERAHGNR